MTELLSFKVDEYVATVSLEVSSGGAISDWWVSVSNGRYLRVIAHLNLIIHGGTVPEARRRAMLLAPSVIEFVSTTWGGELSPDDKLKDSRHAGLHMALHEDALDGISDFAKTVSLYELLGGFKLQNPAVIIAEHLGLNSVRTVHDRIARARKDGLLETYGRGKAHA